MTASPEAQPRPRFVFDTNALASAAILPASVSGRALEWAVANGQLCLSAPLIEEIIDVLHRPRIARYFVGDALEDFLATLARISEMVVPGESIHACRDPKDNKLLELAVAAAARYLVTGDRDLLILNPFRDIEIVSAGTLATRFEGFSRRP